ncbi:UNC93-like protein isoform X2 [Anoplophora glabripennis]|uniref:UNC93-like protein n=2 Tax=Anoplophora glabripennis TaxID=217634 RepID=V5I8T1_ANOGL|nr:UNC93-like protein isoform X2 [Anoplophora glabripennis]XP_018577020.1 UNC93-like protein isoform X2 [Anoplophora glabripennis]
MTASPDNSGADRNGANKRNDDGVYTVSVTGGYDNQGFKGDGNNDDPKKPPREITDEEASQQGKFKLPTKEKWRILKNVSAISCAFMIQFTAFQGTANLQSSINAKDGLGTVSLCAIYAALVVSCIFVPTFLIKKLTVKWTLCLSLMCYAPYIGSQFYPKFYTLVPAGVLLGIGAAPMWASKATYLTQVAGVYAKLTDQAVDGIIVRFFGFFFLAWQTAELWGNLISSLVLSTSAHGSSSSSGNSSNYEGCGANFCQSLINSNDNLDRPADSEIYEISGIYLACIVTAVIMIALVVDPLSRYGEKQGRRSSHQQEMTPIQLLSATAYQLKKPYQQLLIPITVFIGMEQAFIGADFTQSYITCAMGVSQVGYVMICFGCVNAICSLLFGSIMKYIGRAPIMGLGVLVHTGLQSWMLIWRPHPDAPMKFFMAAGLWGVGDAVWQTQVNGLYGTLFRRNKEAAFSNYRLWESVGFVIAYAYSTHLCCRMKLYVQLTILLAGFILYVIVEIHHLHKIRRQKAKEKKAAALEASKQQVPPEPEETDDEKDDIDDEIIVTHL